MTPYEHDRRARRRRIDPWPRCALLLWAGYFFVVAYVAVALLS